MNNDMYIPDPSKEEWLSAEQQKSFCSEFSSCISLLDESGLLQDAIIYWIRREIQLISSADDNGLAWARQQWGHRLDQLFLEKKAGLDQVTCRLLRVSEQGLALELYHRLCSGEAAFDELSIRYGEGSERFKGGLIKKMQMSDFAGGLATFIKKLEPGQISKPLKLGDKFIVLQLIEYTPYVRGEDTYNYLLGQELDKWLAGMANQLKSLLISDCSITR